MKKAWVTLLTQIGYLPGTLVMHRCLQDVETKYPFVVMVTQDVSVDVLDILMRHDIQVRVVKSLHPENASTEVEERFKDTWTKLRQVNIQ